MLPGIDDAASTEMKNALAIRNAATRTGQCPGCGAVLEVAVAPSPGVMGEARMEHESWCPALVDEAGR